MGRGWIDANVEGQEEVISGDIGECEVVVHEVICGCGAEGRREEDMIRAGFNSCVGFALTCYVGYV